MSNPTPPRVRRTPKEAAIGWVLFVLSGPLAAVASFIGLMSMMISDGCMGVEEECDFTRMEIGVAIAVFGHWVVLVAALVLMILRSKRSRTIWWVPILSLALGAGVWVGGLALAMSALPD